MESERRCGWRGQWSQGRKREQREEVREKRREMKGNKFSGCLSSMPVTDKVEASLHAWWGKREGVGGVIDDITRHSIFELLL